MAARWVSIEGQLTSAPAMCSPQLGRMDVFGRGTDNALWHRTRIDWEWGKWRSLGGILTAPPAAVSWGPNRLDVFVRGTDDALWHKWYDGDWSHWESLGGLLNFGPVVASWGHRRLDVIVRGRDNGLWHKWFHHHDWSDWVSIADEATMGTRPGMAAVSSREGRIDLICFGVHDWLIHKWYDEGAGWYDYTQTVGDSFGAETLSTSLAMASWKADRLDIFMRAADRTLAQREAIVSESGNLGYTMPEPKSHGGILTSGPAAVAPHSERSIEVVVRGTDNAYWIAQVFSHTP